MAYMICTAMNQKTSGSVVISCITNKDANGEYGGADNVKVYKRIPEGDWKIVKTYEQSNDGNLDFTLMDVNVSSGTTYEYHVDLCNGSSVIESQNMSVLCAFLGVVISDGTSLWKTEFGTTNSRQKVEVKKNFDVQYVKTLKDRFPRRVSNSSQNYYTGTTTGLFLPLDICGKPTIDGANRHKEEFFEFLCNGEAKLLRTGDGKNYIVSIDGTPQENWNDYTALSTVTFSWTQIGDADILKIDYNGNANSNYILQSKSAESGRETQRVIADDGYYGLSEVLISGMKVAKGVKF